MFENLYPVFKEVIKLASAREELDNQAYGDKVYTLGETFKDESPEAIKAEEAEQKLTNYLLSLDFETVKIIQTIMYLGRDGGLIYGYKDSDAPKEIYSIVRNYFDQNGWNTKEIEVSQTTGKLPLASYLKNGLEILQAQI